MPASVSQQPLYEIHASNFDCVYESCAEPLYKFFFYRLLSEEKAEDLCSDVFLKAFEKMSQYDAQKGTVLCWLYGIAKNVLVDYYRKNIPQENIETLYEIPSLCNIEHEVLQRLEVQDVMKTLHSFPLETRRILLYRLWDEMSYAEIATLTGRTEASVKMLVSRTLKTLRPEHLVGLLLLRLVSSF